MAAAAARDGRVRRFDLHQNDEIVVNTNAGIQRVTGDSITDLDLETSWSQTRCSTMLPR